MEAQTSRLWAIEKSCNICGVALGHGSLKERRLYCQHCSHAICGNCVAPKSVFSARSRKRTCKRCAATHQYDPRATVQNPSDEWRRQADVMSSFRSERSVTFDSISDMSELHNVEDSALIDSVLSSARLLSESMVQHSSTPYEVEKDIRSYNQLVTRKFAEIQTLKEQEKWYSESLQKRDSEIHELSIQVEQLTDINNELQSKIKQMEAKIVQPQQKPPPQEEFFCCTHASCALQ